MEELEQLGYLARLMIRLTFGAAKLPSETQKLHGDYVLSRQRPDGGWAGREGESDIYYTSFALRSLAILGLLDGKVAQRSAGFLRSRMHSHEGIVDLLSLVYSVKLLEATCSLDAFADAQDDWEKRLAELLDTLRRDDGGFSKSLEGRTGSTYQTFLVLLCLELIERPCPQADAAYNFLMSQQQDDGGFLEIRVGKRSGANPTAAAMGALRILGKLHDVVAEDAAEFLAELQTDEGGFQANTRIPLPDLLSTFTACVTLADVERLESISTKGVQRYAESMQQATGGFRGFEYDPGDDVEYSFYGLGTLALLQTL
ncbi:MAG: prenyltransferase/squalene oxidase repeat-containing protein [Planctomycetota bacterium]